MGERVAALRSKVSARHCLPVDGSGATRPWRASVDSLVPLLSALPAQRASVAITLSDRFARYFALPSSPALVAEPDWQVFAARRFEALFGAAAASHSILLSGRSSSVRLACAVERALIDAIRVALQRAGHRLASLRPNFAACFDHARRRIGAKDAWFVSQEPGSLTIGLAISGDWRSLRQRRVGAQWMEELPALLDRETQLAGVAARVPTTYVALLDAGHLQPNLGGFAIQQVVH